MAAVYPMTRLRTGRRLVLAAWMAAVALAPTMPVAAATPASCRPAEPDPTLPVPASSGSVMELQAHRRSGVVSMWLSNGVRLHHMWFAPAESAGRAAQAVATSSAKPAPRLVITVTIPGGPALETAQTLGLSQAAAMSWAHPCCKSAPATVMGKALDSRGIEVKGWALPDSLVLRAEVGAMDGPREGPEAERACADRLEVALQAVRLLVTEPVVDSVSVDEYNTERAKSESKMPRRGAVSDAIMTMTLPEGDVRFRYAMEGAPPVTAEAVQAWLDRSLRSAGGGAGGECGGAPLEIAIVGQVKLDDAVRLSAKYLGSLPARGRIGSTTYRMERFTPRPDGPATCDRVETGAATADGRACVAAGFFGPETIKLRDHRALTLMTMALRWRAAEDLKAPAEPAEGRSAISAWTMPGGWYPPGQGMVVAVAAVEPGVADAAKKRLQDTIAALREADLPAGEFEKTREAYLDMLHSLIADPGYWSSEVLAGTTYRGYGPDDLAGAEEMIRRLTPADLREVWAKYATPERAISVTLRPK